jgi:hypothetical protein
MFGYNSLAAEIIGRSTNVDFIGKSQGLCQVEVRKGKRRYEHVGNVIKY